MKDNNRWARLLVEGAAVVASILIAFSLDAWWDQRESTSRLRAEPRSVSEEMIGNRDLIDFQVDLMQRQVRGGDRLLELAGDGASRMVTVP